MKDTSLQQLFALNLHPWGEGALSATTVDLEYVDMQRIRISRPARL